MFEFRFIIIHSNTLLTKTIRFRINKKILAKCYGHGVFGQVSRLHHKRFPKNFNPFIEQYANGNFDTMSILKHPYERVCPSVRR